MLTRRRQCALSHHGNRENLKIMDITIREYTEADAPRVATLMDAFHDYLVDIDPNNRLCRLSGYGEATLAEELRATSDGRGVILVAADGAQVVGFVVVVLAQPLTEDDLLGTKPSTRGRINELYVTGEYRGKGVARALMDIAEARLRERGCDTAFLGVFAFNTDAIAMYEHIGYNIAGVEMMKKL